MSKRVEKAVQNHKNGYNCCQAVACAFSDALGVDETVLFKAAEGFGLGMGCTECTCGAVSGAAMVAGFKNSDGNLKNPATKGSSYRLSKEIVKAFVEKNGSAVCKELKGITTGTVLRSCPGCVEDAAMLAEQIIFDTELESN